MTEDGSQERQRDLRERAEAILARESIDLSRLSSQDVEGLFEELRVHQIELELQNEELRATQIRLQRLGEQYRHLYDSAPVGYVTLDEDGRIQRANLTLAAMLRQGRDELLEERLSGFVAPEDQSTFHFFQTGLLQSAELQHCEVRLVRPDGSQFVARLEGQVKREVGLGEQDAGASGAYRVAISDVTQEWQARQALLKAHDQLARANRALRDEMARREQIEAELAEIQRHLVQGQEVERMDLAHRLHEGAVQDLYGIGFHLGVIAHSLQEQIDQTGIAKLRETLQATARMLRGACQELRPSALTPFGLGAAIRSDVERFQEAHPELDVRLELMKDAQTLPEPLRLILFRVYQEALDNVVQHARADRVWIRFRFDPQEVVLEVQDDGQGFELPERWVVWARQGRLGLVGAMERVKTVDGRLKVASTPGEGTTVRVVAPRPAAAPKPT